MERAGIENVPLGSIHPSVDNPRRDFGDLEALAESFKATGGVPVNPIVCVADGNVWRIVDGERRYRALKTLYADDHDVPVLAFRDASAAHEIVAMLATDDKLRLSEAEQVQGFQTALALGVEEVDVARVLHRKVADVRKARLVANEAPEQATLDQMIAAVDFTGEDREKVLAAAPEEWRSVAESIRRRVKQDAIADELSEAVDLLVRSGRLAICDEAPDGWRIVANLVYAEDLTEMVEDMGDCEGGLAVWPCIWDRRRWILGESAPQAEPETPEERERREHDERVRTAFRALRRAVVREVGGCDIMPKLQDVAGMLRCEGYNPHHVTLRRELVANMGVPDMAVDSMLRERASMYETAEQLWWSDKEWWDWTTTYLPPAIEEDYEPSEEDMWLLDQARAEATRRREEGGDES